MTVMREVKEALQTVIREERGALSVQRRKSKE